MTTKHLKADIPLAERRRIEREQWNEIRAALVRRHFQVTTEDMLIEELAFRARLQHLREHALTINAMLDWYRSGTASMPMPVVTPEPERVAPAPEPLPVRSGAPDLPFDLRQRFGLR